ncbi:hypothetical protein GOP47_0012559 [Adiantum capillus-veneris]|uniref:Uncharacterized protein n=1 Tax=Adiantum capillus-veneris TaxID=13818 RepID=A0A9D4USA3_ADICA|nr:hypothetical protein GOP47_0012559 [Adiantum capillus-veneris]
METPAEEIDLLLEEIPRATSAPPHFKSSSGAPEGSPAPYLPDALFERKLPTSLSDSHVMSLAVNPNPNPNPNATHSPSSNQSPSVAPRIPLASPKQQSLAAYRESRLLGGDETIVGNTLASLSLQEGDADSLHMLLDNRNKVYSSNSLLQDFSVLNPASPVSYVNQLPHISSTPALSMMKSRSVPASHTSMLHPFADATFLDHPRTQDHPHLQDFQMNNEPSPANNAFCMGSPFLEDERTLSSLGANNFMMRQGFEQQKAEQLASQQGYDWNPSLQKGSYFNPLLDELCDQPALSLGVSKQLGCRAVHNKDIYGNFLPTSSPEITSDGHLLALIQQQKLQLARQTMEEKLHLQQLNASLYDQLRYVKKPAKYSNYMTDLQDLQYTSGSISPVYESALLGNDTNCRFYAQGHCIRGSTCPFLHPASYGESGPFVHSPKESFAGAGLYDKLGALAASQAFQQWRPQSNGNYNDLVALGRRRRERAGLLVGNGQGLLHVDDSANAKALLDESSDSLQQLLKFTNLEDLEGKIFGVAKDQHGCRFLQKKLDDAKPEDVELIFQEIKEHVVQLMTDPFGNYLVQKLLDACNESHRSAILEAVTKNDDLINISLNMHGTRAVQKLIETLHTPDQIAMLISCLKRGVVTLIKDLNGNHVVQRCLQRFKTDNNQFIFDAAASHCVEIASHRHGCCVLQRCVDFASGVQQRQLVTEIATNALALSQDQYGNYVVQYILDLGLPWALVEVVSRLEGSFPHLAMQKFSSNVVEKCLKVATDESKSIIVKELMSSSSLSQLLQDPYANYVIQSALQVTKGHLHASVIDAIKPHVHVLRSSPYGKRILSRTQFKK